MKLRYLCDMLRKMDYWPARFSTDDTETYMLQTGDGIRMIYSGRGTTEAEMLKGVKAAGIRIHGKHWADYMTPKNGLEKRMMDDVIQLATIVNALATVETLQALGFSLSEAKKIMKDAAYVIPEGQRVIGEGKR